MQKHAAYVALAIACAITLSMVVALKPATAAAGVAIGAWLLCPYLLLAAALRFLARSPKALRTYTTMAVVIPLGALAFLAYVIYIAPDAQGAIAVMFTPLYQLVAAVVLFAICDWAFSN
jgi:hypothetical protein